MKTKLIAAALAVLSIFSLTACQETPEQPVVIQKDSERMIQQAKADDGTDALAMLGIPENHTYDAEGANGKLHINVDADVNVPEVDAMPILRASMDIIAQEQVTGMFNYLFHDEKPKTIVGQVETKDVIEQEILRVKRMLTDENYSQFSKEQLEAQIAMLEKSYNEAPDTPPEAVISDGTLQQFGDTSLHLSVENDDYTFYVNTGTSIALDEDVTGTVGVRYSSKAMERNYRDQPGSRWELGAEDMPKDVEQRLTIPYEEAEKLCEGFLQAAGIKQDFILDVVKVINNAVDTAEDRQIDYTYQFEYARLANGLPLASGDNNVMFEDEQFNFKWRYEELVIQVDNKGIANIVWDSPIKINETVSDTAALKPFDEIMGIFEGMMNTTYSGAIKTHFNDEVELDVSVTDIELGLMRVREKNAEATDGLIIPVWVFYGSNKGTSIDGETRYLPGSTSISSTISAFGTGIASEEPVSSFDLVGGTTKYETTLLVINAIDGSIIDPSKGY